MKFTAKIAFATAAGLFAGSALAFQDSMVDYPQNVAYEQQRPVVEHRTNAVGFAAINHINYPAAFVDTAPHSQQLTRQEVNMELAHFVGDHFRIGVSPNYPEQG